MWRQKVKRTNILVIGVVVLVGVGLIAFWLLSREDSSSSEKPIPEDKREMLVDAADSMDQAKSFLLLLAYRGPDVLLGNEDFPLPIALVGVEGVFVSPNKLGATVNIRAQDQTGIANVIAIEDVQYVNESLFLTQSDEWIEYTFTDFQPKDLQSPEKGIGTALKSVENVELIGEEELEAVSVYHLRGDIPAINVQSLTVGLIGTTEGYLKVDIYLRKNDWKLARVVIKEPPNEVGQVGQWTIDFSRYDNDFTIEVPEISTPSPEEDEALGS